ncbi:MAG: AAA family ATPase, partial [Oligoflexales bacterium]|nr:AAA family ATPase [Oligoflexales bacterium]
NATTIHRLLQWSPESGAFIKNETNRLEFDVVIVDETSMMDITLASALFQAIASTTQVILIGDIYQLPAVGPGNVLRDLIQSSKIKTFELNKIFRQAASSNIILTAHKINRGENPEFRQEDTSDCIFIETKDTEDFKSRLFELITNTLPKKFNIDPKSEVQLLSPMKKGDFGTQVLNLELQTWLNPNNNKNGISRNAYKFFTGDKVIQCSNNYELNVFNGDIGFILNIDQKANEATILFGEREIIFNSDQLSDLQLAYAITIHKSQGSEFPIVIIPIALSHYVMLQRNLIYTALTRARRYAIFIGQKKALHMAVGNNRSQKRQTRLSERLLQAERIPAECIQEEWQSPPEDPS